MVQEFHVLRCFSCKIFQVQQVKKSKKWSCKMCGEKQSLIKEYGRGTGADCRRHVQKLNSLHGELLEVENETVYSHWEKEEECKVEVEVSPGDETPSWQQKGQPQVVSRWSKFVDQKENGPESEEDEPEEKKRVYTDTEQRRRRNNIRKRKKSFTSRATYRRYNAEEDQEKDTAHGGAARPPSQPRRHDATFDSSLQVPRPSIGFPAAHIHQRTDALRASPAASLGSEGISDVCSQFTGANKQSSAELSTKLQHSVPLSSFSAPSFAHQQPSETKLEAKVSKWARFLPSVCVEVEDDAGEHAQCLDEDHTALVQSPVMPVAKVLPNNTGSMCSGRSEGALLDTVCGVEKVTQCVNGNVCKQPTSPSITSRPVGSQNPVCVQPLPIRKPGFSFSTLFHTDEDFDDAY